MKNELNNIKNWIISEIVVNDNFTLIRDVIKEIIINDNDYPGTDINLFIEDKDETNNYYLWKVANIAFVCNIDKILTWLLSIKNKFLKYTKKYYSDLGFIDILVKLNGNRLCLNIDLERRYVFANGNDAENDYFSCDFDCDINNFTKEEILKLKW